jgi:ADP-ribose pyrophosphatase YjhB (NUDIX family)
VISFDLDGIRFNFRFGGVCVHDGHVLLNRNSADDWWYLPGGRCAPLEASADTLAREIQEELQVDIQLGELIWVIENFFQLGGRDWHEVGLYYRFALPEICQYVDKARSYTRIDTDMGLELIYAWVPLAGLNRIRLLPAFLAERLQRLPTSSEHIVHWDIAR